MGILDVSVKQKGSDELSILSECFNSMQDSIRDHIRRQTELTKQLEGQLTRNSNKRIGLKDEVH